MGKKELLVIVLVVVVSRYLLLEFQPFSSSEEGDGVDKEKEMEKECLALLKKGETFRDLAYSKDGWWEDFSASRQAYTKAQEICGSLKPDGDSETRPEELFASLGVKSSLFREMYHRSHLSSVAPLVHWFLGGGFAESENPSSPFGFSVWFAGEEEGCHSLSIDHSLLRLASSLVNKGEEGGKCGVVVAGDSPMKVEEVLLGALGGWREEGGEEEGEEGDGEGCEVFLLEDLLEDLPDFLYSVFFSEFLEGGKRPTIKNYRDLGEALHLDQLYIVSVEVQKQFNSIYVAEASASFLLINAEEEMTEELPTISASSYCQDRSRAVPAGLTVTLLAFIMTAYLPPLLQKIGFFSPPSSEADKLQLAVYTFPISTLVSFITPWLLRGDMVGLDELAPSSHVHFGRGIGWVFFYCSLLLIAPLLLTLIVVVRFKKIVEVLREPWMLQLIYMGSVLGSSLYLFLGSTLYCGFRAFETLLLFPLLLSSAFFLGKFVADFCGGFREIKLYLLSEFCSCVLFLALICSVRSSYLMWQVSLFVAGFGTCIIPIVRHRRLKKKSTQQERAAPALFIGGELSGLPSLSPKTKKDTLPNALKSHDSLPFHGHSALNASQTLTKSFFSDEPHVAVLFGPRGSGKTRATKEAFNNPSIPFCPSSSSSSSSSYSVEFPIFSGGKGAKPPRFQVHIGSAGHGAHGTEESCPPLQPLVKAFGKLVGYRRFKGAESQFSGVIAADEAIGLSTFLPLNGGDEGEEGDGGPDLNVLVDAICRTLRVHCRNLKQEGLRLAIVLEDMEFSDSSTQETIQLLCRRFSQHPEMFGLTIAICVRDDDPSLSEEGQICLPEWVSACSECLPESQFSTLQLTLWSLQEIEELLENLGFHSTFIQENGKEFYEKTEGNALWVHNVLKQIWEKELLQWFSSEFTGDGWIFNDDVPGFSSLPMPSELVQVLQERIAQLSLDDRQLLIAATLIGTEFNAVLLAEAIGRDPLQVLLRLHHLEETTGIICDIRDEEEIYRFSSGGYVDALLGLADLKISVGEGIPELHRLFHNRLATVLEKWIISREISDLSQSIFELARHSSFAGARKRCLAFLSNFLAALEVNSSGGGFAELSNYALNALNCYSSMGKSLISEVFNGTNKLEVVCRHHLPSYKSFMLSSSYELKVADKIISHLCYLRATALLKMNPVANKTMALNIFTNYEPKHTPDVLVTLSLCYTLKDEFVKAEEMANLAKSSYSLDPLSGGSVCWALSLTKLRQRSLPSFQFKQENSTKRILELSFEGLTLLSTILPQLGPFLHALQHGDKQEILDLMKLETRKILNEERKRPALRIVAKMLCVVGMVYMQEKEFFRSCFALRIGNKAALLGKDLFAEVLVGGSLARCLCVLLMKGKGGEAERKEAGDLWKKCQKICAKTDNYSGEVSALVGLGDLASLKKNISKATKFYVQALNVATSCSRKGYDDGAHLKIPPLLSLLTLYFVHPTPPSFSPLLIAKSETDIAGSIEKTSQLLLDNLSLYTDSPSNRIDFHLAQHSQKFNQMKALLEKSLFECDEEDERRVWAERLLKKISLVLVMLK